MRYLWEVTLPDGNKARYAADRCWVDESGALCLSRDSEDGEGEFQNVIIISFANLKWDFVVLIREVDTDE